MLCSSLTNAMLIKYRVGNGGFVMARLIDDLAGAIYDFFKAIFKSMCYFFSGMLIVGAPLYLIVLAFKMFY